MAHLDNADIEKVFSPVNGGGGGVLPCVETPSGGVKNAQGNADGAALVEITGGTVTATVDTSLLATEATVDEVSGASKAASATGALTKSDTTTYSPPLKVLWASGAGNVTVMLADDTASVVTFPIAAGEFVTAFRIKKVMDATTATGVSGAQ